MLLLFISLLLVEPNSFAEFGSRQNGHFSRPETGPTASPQDKIIGGCTILAGGGNLMAQPCGNLVLTLDSQDGAGILYSRTSATGAFEFNVPSGKSFTLGVNSKFFEVVSPKAKIQKG